MLFALLAATVIAAPLDDDQLEARLLELATSSGEVVVVGSGSSAAIAFVREIADKNPQVSLRVERHKTEASLAMSLAEAGKRCGALVAYEVDGWAASVVGDCTAEGGDTSWIPAGFSAKPKAKPEPMSASTDLLADDEATEDTAPPRTERVASGDTPAKPPKPSKPPAKTGESKPVQGPQPAPSQLTDADIERIIGAQRRHARALLASPDPGAAAVLSLALGFGAGHFYAKQNERGYLHLGAQLGGLLAMGLGQAVLLEARTEQAATFGSLLVYSGSLTFSIDRIVDIWTAPQSAHDTGRDMLR